MALWVVKYASRRSRIEDFSGDSSVRDARIRGVLASHASAGQRGLLTQGVEPDGRGFTAGFRPFGVGRLTGCRRATWRVLRADSADQLGTDRSIPRRGTGIVCSPSPCGIPPREG